MSAHFSPERWQRVRDAARLWWAGELDRPLVLATLGGFPAGRPEPKRPHLDIVPLHGDAPAEEIIDAKDYVLSTQRFLGDAFPAARMNFGPGVIAAFMGAELEATDRTVWFHPREKKEPSELSLKLDTESRWFKRLRACVEAADDRWRGDVLVQMTDIGGNLDVVSTFLPSEQLLLALYDSPDEVKRLLWETHEAWFQAYDALDAASPNNPGRSYWLGLYSEPKSYVLQCDFCYMIGPDMFEEFVLPELAASCRRLGNAIYHLDGVGQLPHLDMLLAIPELKGIQWVPGAGKPEAAQWPDVIKRILDAGKLVQLGGSVEALDDLAAKLGGLRGCAVMLWSDAEGEGRMRDFLERHGVQP